MDKKKEIEDMAKELHCATNESFVSCRKIARILVERRGYGNVEQAVREFAEKLKDYIRSKYAGCETIRIWELDQLIKERFGKEV